MHTSPHDLEGYDEPLFPVADLYRPHRLRDLLRLALSGGDAPTRRQRSAEVLLRVSAYMDPGERPSPADWWTVINRSACD
ncbi:MAG: hypothetical protein WKF84_18705 [Pyrinomonadaceae bacterium]